MVAAGVFKPSGKGIPITIKGVLPTEPKRPEWMKVKANLGNDYRSLKNLLSEKKLNTVCEEASCPNIYECWSMGTATFMIMGDVCTRACGFCDVKTGKPGTLVLGEPARVAESVKAMELTHAVITSVNREDLEDGGSQFFADTINEVLKPKGVAVVIDASHGCMSTRGIHKTESSTITSRMLGIFREDNKANKRLQAEAKDPNKKYTTYTKVYNLFSVS